MTPYTDFAKKIASPVNAMDEPLPDATAETLGRPTDSIALIDTIASRRGSAEMLLRQAANGYLPMEVQMKLLFQVVIATTATLHDLATLIVSGREGNS